MTIPQKSTDLNAMVVTLPLWPAGVPGALGCEPADIPDITVYQPPAGHATGAAVVICPGGGYGCLCSSYEGHDIAQWLNRYGICGVVLKYRLAPYRHPVPLQDASRAMRLVRFHAKAWNIATDMTGIMGFSAGGHLASALATRYDSGNTQAADPVEHINCRPDFAILIYPVISMDAMKMHGGSCNNLLGPDSTQEARDSVSSELHVTSGTPPAFIAHSIKDSVVPVANSRIFRDALKNNGVPVEYFELTSGDHGLGCGKGEEWAAWQAECLKWMKSKRLAN